MSAVGPYVVAAVASLIAAVVLLRLWNADLYVPFDYRGDALFFEMQTKSIVEHGWYLTNPRLGAPGVLTLHDFPLADAFHNLAIKIMSVFTSSWALIFNLYFLAGFPLITLSALAVFRHFRVAFPLALAGSLLYAFLPSRLLTGETHYQLDIFYQVPLAVLVALWVAGDVPPLPRAGRRCVAAIAISALTSTMGVYYAFFTTVLTLAGGVWASARRCTPRNALAGVMLTGVVATGLGAQAVPTLLYRRGHGENTRVAARGTAEAEIYGLKIAQLLLPVYGHRAPWLRHLRERYDAPASTTSNHVASPAYFGNGASALGAVGSAGFLSLLGLILLGARAGRQREQLLRPLAVLNLVAVLLATIGGFGSLFALMVTPLIRAYGRMSVVIAFLSLFAVVLHLERLAAGRRRLVIALASSVLAFGFLDQVSSWAVRPYAETQAAFGRDARFVRGIETALPPGAMVFQLPYHSFPEGGNRPGARMEDYDSVRPYLHSRPSRSLRWSYPAMRGRSADGWIERTAEQEPARMVQTLSDAGFGGLMLDRYGYAADTRPIEGALATEIGAAPMFSEDGRLVFFDLTAYSKRALDGLSQAERQRRRDQALSGGVQVRWQGGFYEIEHWQNGSFRWCGSDGTMVLDNQSTAARQVALTMTLSAARPPATLAIAGDLLSEAMMLGPGGVRLSRTLTVAPGRHVIRFRCDGDPADSRTDRRRLIWRIDDLRLDDLIGANH
jgi:hypothetical protein